MLVMVVSGGHTLLLIVKSYTQIVKLGTTVDDAAGEAFDKVAKMIGLGYPGGPKIQKAGALGDPESIKFPVAELSEKYNFSFSGLKTSVLRYIQKEYGDSSRIPEERKCDIAASFQNAVIKAIIKNSERALKNYEVKSMSVVGGVAANKPLREALHELANKYGKKFVVPAMTYCGDNAAMIAYRGQKVYESGQRFTLDYNAFPALPLNIFSE